MKYQEVTLGRFLRIILVMLVVAISYFVLNSLSSVLLPFAVAWLLAYLLYPMVRFVQYKMRFKYRLPSIVAVLFFVLLLIVAAFMLVIPSMLDEFAQFKNIAVAFLNDNIKNPTIPPVAAEYMRNLARDEGLLNILSSAGVQDFIQELAHRAQMLLVGTVNVVAQLFGAFITLLYMFFILLDYEHLADEWPLYLPVRWRATANKLSSDLIHGMNQYFRGQALVALCVGILFAIGFVIIDFPIAIGFGLFIGVLNLVPYLQIVSLFPMALLAMLKAANTGDNFWLVLAGALVVLCIVQTIQDLLLVPFIMGRRMNLHPALILLSLSVWGKLLGLLGMIVALPLTTLLLGYLKSYHALRSDAADDSENPLERAVDGAEFAATPVPDKEKTVDE
ncbi:MAG: AI-2E family transporter [Oscillospiraceae bacterium]|nr:AI-2E family transporter [Oscillospiraceae bacterium]